MKLMEQFLFEFVDLLIECEYIQNSDFKFCTLSIHVAG